MTVASSINLFPVTALIVLDDSGERIISKYYPEAFPGAQCETLFQTYADQRKFEKKIHEMTRDNPDNEVGVMDNLVVVYRPNLDVIFYIIGGLMQNEIVLQTILDCFFQSLQELLK